MSTLSSNYVTLIAELDKTLAMVREFWLAARDPKEQAKNRVRLDELLDQRLSLMSARDAAAQVEGDA